jgi:YHS domain-containing protein
MRKICFAVMMISLLVGVVAARSVSEGTEKKNVTNKMCPVSGGAVSEKYRAEYKGQFVYMCCEGCLSEFNKSPETFVAKLSKEDQEAIKVNELCPISKEPIDKKLSVEFEGRKVYFCCDHCVEAYKKDHPAAK